MRVDAKKKGTSKQFKGTSYPLGFPGPGLGAFQVTLISDEEMLKALTSVGASLGSGDMKLKYRCLEKKIEFYPLFENKLPQN